MKSLITSVSIAAVAALSSAAHAQDGDFNLTYHVERTPAPRLSIESCGRAVTSAARQAGLTADAQSYPGKLVVVKGGRRGTGAFVAQCIAVGTTTVSVVQGIDYRATKGAMGGFADKAFAAVKASVK